MTGTSSEKNQIVIVGGGSAGIAVAASLLQRDAALEVTVVEPGSVHYYQPGWTFVGGGIFTPAQTQRNMASVMPKSVQWLHKQVSRFDPENNAIILNGGEILGYDILVVAPGNVLNWAGVQGLESTMGQHGVTSNYCFSGAPYTWQLVQSLKNGRALFTQPPMPIKCAGAPQKVMYLSCDHWKRQNRLDDIDVEFHTSGDVIFGVKEYVPALMETVDHYDIDLRLQSRLIAVDGPAREATFATPNGEITERFDMLHATPPQIAPKFVAESAIANDEGYVDVDQFTLQHNLYRNIFGLGDACSAPNAKTMAAARKQAPVVAQNIIAKIQHLQSHAVYDGYGSCPLTIARGKIVLAEFGYGGELLPTFPKWLINPVRPSRKAWMLKKYLLPWVYWNGMLKGHEWLAKPEIRSGALAD